MSVVPESSPELDIHFVRQQFPALSSGDYQDVAFFENAGGTYVPEQVIQHMQHFLVNHKVQPYAPYPMSTESTERIEQATVAMADMINAEHGEVLIGHCSSMNLYLLANALRNWIGEGNEIIVTNQDHEANISPWRRLQRSGVVIREWRIRANGELDLEDLLPMLSRKTRLVCMPHSSNIIGSVNDIKRVAHAVHAVGGLLLVDGVSYAPHHAINVKHSGVNVYVLSLYKLFGPHLGLMYVNAAHHDKLSNQSLEFLPAYYANNRQPGAPNYLRIVLNPGLVNHESVASLNGLVEYFKLIYQHHFTGLPKQFHTVMETVFKLIGQYQLKLSRQFIEGIRHKQEFELIGQSIVDPDKRSPTYCLKIYNGRHARDNATALAEHNIAVQSGSFYAWRCLRALGINPDDGVLRISMAHFNTVDEVSRLNMALESLI